MGSVSRDPDAAAASWYARLHADDATPADRAAFGQWLSADDEHDRAWHELVSTTRILDDARSDPALLARVAAARDQARPAPARRWWPMAVAAAAVLSIGGTATLVVDRYAAGPATPGAGPPHWKPAGPEGAITPPAGKLIES